MRKDIHSCYHSGYRSRRGKAGRCRDTAKADVVPLQVSGTIDTELSTITAREMMAWGLCNRTRERKTPRKNPIFLKGLIRVCSLMARGAWNVTNKCRSISRSTSDGVCVITIAGSANIPPSPSSALAYCRDARHLVRPRCKWIGRPSSAMRGYCQRLLWKGCNEHRRKKKLISQSLIQLYDYFASICILPRGASWEQIRVASLWITINPCDPRSLQGCTSAEDGCGSICGCEILPLHHQDHHEHTFWDYLAW